MNMVGGWASTPLKKIRVCRLGWWSSQCMDKQTKVPNHQSVYLVWSCKELVLFLSLCSLNLMFYCFKCPMMSSWLGICYLSEVAANYNNIYLLQYLDFSTTECRSTANSVHSSYTITGYVQCSSAPARFLLKIFDVKHRWTKHETSAIIWYYL